MKQRTTSSIAMQESHLKSHKDKTSLKRTIVHSARMGLKSQSARLVRTALQRATIIRVAMIRADLIKATRVALTRDLIRALTRTVVKDATT